MFDFTFRTVQGTKDLRQLVDFLAAQDLGYPQYDDWVQRTELEIDSGYKVPIIAYSGSHIVGDLIYQMHKQLPRVRELKNLRVHESMRHRDFAHFMLRQGECDNPDQYDAIICDLRSSENTLMKLLTFAGYVPLGRMPLYDSNIEDVIFMKVFGSHAPEGLVYSAKNVVLGK
jgi:hypothetical protein